MIRTAFAIGLLASVAAAAAPLTFSFDDPKGVNSVSFLLDSTIEPIMGYADGISGTLTYDPAKPAATTGKIVIDAGSIAVTHERMTQHMHGEEWLNVKQNTEVSFAFKEVKSVETVGENTDKLHVVGDFLCAGVTKEIAVYVMVSHIKDGVAQRMGKGEGDLLIVRSNFSIDRTEFGIKPEYGPEKVAHKIAVTVAIAGIEQ